MPLTFGLALEDSFTYHKIAMAMSPSFAKNTIRRMLWSLVDSEPTRNEISELLGYFGQECFYCGKEFISLNDDFTLDHIVPRARGGTNGIANRLPACTCCNCHERRDKPFEEFLRSKCESNEAYNEKLHLVKMWCMSSFQQHQTIPRQLFDLVENSEIQIGILIDDCVSEIRKKRKQLGFPRYTAKEVQRLSGIAAPIKGLREKGNCRRR